MGFQVIRLKKLKCAEDVAQAAGHQMRSAKPDHIIREKMAENEYGSPDMPKGSMSKLTGRKRQAVIMDRYRELLPKKIKSNAVHAFEVLISGSPESIKALPKEAQRRYLRESLNWIEKQFGGKANILGYSIHHDERTCGHMGIILMPLYKGSLNAKHYVDGPKFLREFQTRFNVEVAAKYGLERGEEGSNDVHIPPQEYYEKGREWALLEKERLAKEKAQRREEAKIRRESGGFGF